MRMAFPSAEYYIYCFRTHPIVAGSGNKAKNIKGVGGTRQLPDFDPPRLEAVLGVLKADALQSSIANVTVYARVSNDSYVSL